MRITRSASLLAATVAILAGCSEGADSGGGGPDPTATPDSSAAADTGAPAGTGDVIPDGTYAKTVTLSDARRLGLPKDKIDEVLGPDGQYHERLKIAGDNWAQFGDEGGNMALGDGGTATYDADGHWLATSGSGGAVHTLEWSLEDDQLTLTLLDTTEVGDPADLLVARLVMEGTHTRQ